MQQKVIVQLRDFPDVKPFEVEFDPSQLFSFIKSKIAQRQNKIPDKQLVCVLENQPKQSLKESDTNQRQKVTPNSKILAIHVDHLLDPKNLIKSVTNTRQDTYQNDDQQQKLEESVNNLMIEKQRYEDQISKLKNQIQDLEYSKNQSEEKLQQQQIEFEQQFRQKDLYHEEEIDQIKIQENLFKEQLTIRMKSQIQENSSQKKVINELQDKLQEFKEKIYELQREKDYTQEECERYRRQLMDQVNKTGKVQEVDFMKIKNELDFEKQKTFKLETSIATLKEEKSGLKKIISEMEIKYNDINQELQRLLVQNQREKDEYKRQISQLENEISDLKRHLEQKVREIDRLIEKTKQQNTSIIELNAKNQDVEGKKERLQQELNEKDIKLVQLESKLKGIQENKATNEDQWSKQQSEQQEKISNYTIEITKAKKEIQLQKQTISEQDSHIAMLKEKIQELLQKNQKLSDEFTKYSDTINKQFKVKEEKIAVMEERKNKMIARIKNNQGKSKINNGITTAIFDLFRLNYDISQFLSGANAQTDEQQFTVQKIIANKETLENKIKKLSDLDFNDAYKLEPAGEIICIKSLQSNGFGTYCKVSVLQDVNQKQFYVIKESNKIQTDQSVSSLQQFFLPTLIAEFILDKFVEALKKSDAERQPYKFRFQEQFIFQQNTKYYYAQKISQVDKFNLYNGKQNNQPEIKTCQYLNAYTIFSFKYSQQQLMVDNVQGSSDTLYDPIINTDDGLFNEEDLGQDRIDELMRNAKDDAKFHGKQLLTSLSIKI